jgi:hypothetical protein
LTCGAADEALGAEHLVGELGVTRVNAGIDHGDGDRFERRKGQPRLVEAALRQVPLLRDERVRRREGELAPDERLDVPNAADASQGPTCRKLDEERGNRSEALRPTAGPLLDRFDDRSPIGTSLEADCDAGRIRTGGSREPERRCRDDGEHEADHPVTSSVGDTPAARPSVAEMRAR